MIKDERLYKGNSECGVKRCQTPRGKNLACERHLDLLPLDLLTKLRKNDTNVEKLCREYWGAYYKAKEKQ